ncbi:hypothetical protein ACR6C2_37830 [Streptomyces sp. INA 01156]
MDLSGVDCGDAALLVLDDPHVLTDLTDLTDDDLTDTERGGLLCPAPPPT